MQARLDSLTPRGREVLVHVVSGQLNKQIAADLGTVEKTIKVHRARVMEKMGVESLADLVRAAERLGLGNRPPSPAAESADRPADKAEGGTMPSVLSNPTNTSRNEENK